MSTTPADLADTLARNGARIAMELDIDPERVQLDTARSAGGPLTIAVPGQVRPADQYLAGGPGTSSLSWPRSPGRQRRFQ